MYLPLSAVGPLEAATRFGRIYQQVRGAFTSFDFHYLNERYKVYKMHGISKCILMNCRILSRITTISMGIFDLNPPLPVAIA